MERVLITGLGVVSCLGSRTEVFWRRLSTVPSQPGDERSPRQERRALARTLSMHAASARSEGRTRRPDPHIGSERPLRYAVADADLPARPEGTDGVPLGRASHLAVAAARQAVIDAAFPEVPPWRLGVVVGTLMGEPDPHEQGLGSPVNVSQGRARAFTVASAVGNSLGACGANASISNACAAGGYALAVAADMIRCGEADVVVAGGADTYSPEALGCLDLIGAIDPVRCRPFDRHRRGISPGEGAALLVLESESHARERDAPTVYARLAGSGWSRDARRPATGEHTAAQVARAAQQALDEARASPDSIGCVVPHATGSGANDLTESRALREIFGTRCLDVPLCSLQARIGHTGGGAGAFAALVAALILQRGVVPPNVPLDEQDPECKVWVPQTGAVPMVSKRVLVNTRAPGGNSASLVLESAAG